MLQPSAAEWTADDSVPILELTIGELLRETAAHAPDAVALVTGMPEAADRRRWTYAELLEESERAARALLGRFGPGDRVAVWAAVPIGSASSTCPSFKGCAWPRRSRELRANCSYCVSGRRN